MSQNTKTDLFLFPAHGAIARWISAKERGPVRSFMVFGLLDLADEIMLNSGHLPSHSLT